MKKIKLMFTVLCLMALASCTKDNQENTTLPDSDTVEIELNFSQPQGIITRSFFDEVEENSAWESRFSGVRLLIYDMAGILVAYANLTVSDSSPVATISIPREVCGTTCHFYAFANYGGGPYDYPTETELLEHNNVYCSASVYNIYQADFLFEPQSFRVVMSASKYVDIADYGLKTVVHIELVRTLAKIAFEYEVDENFGATHDGATIVIETAALQNVSNNNAYLAHRPGIYYDGGRSSFTQRPRVEGRYMQNLWYCYETSASAGPVILIKGWYDYDGNLDTVDDRTPVQFIVPVGEATGGNIDRNTYYRIKGIIKGVGDMNLDITFSAKEWTTQDESVDIGV